MSVDKMTPEQVIAAFDQAETGMENVAKLVGNFRKRLMEEGISAEVAEKIVWAWFIKSFMGGQEPK